MKEIENALRERRIDLAVHSLKDLPTAQPEGLRVIVTGPREDVRDVLVSPLPVQLDDTGLHIAPSPSGQLLRIGTSSLRRTAQLRALIPDATILPIRGNVDTRLRKLAQGDYDAIVLAAAGLHRLALHEELADRLTYLPLSTLLPAPGQGALALEIREEPTMLALLAPLRDRAAQAATTAERSFMRELGAGCYLPVAAYGEMTHETLMLSALVTSLDGQRRVQIQRQMYWTPETPLEQAEALGVQLARRARDQGAATIIDELRSPLEQEQQHV